MIDIIKAYFPLLCVLYLRIAVQMDNPLPSNYEEFSFGYGENYEKSLPNSSVPDGYRRRLYIRIINND